MYELEEFAYNDEAEHTSCPYCGTDLEFFGPHEVEIITAHYNAVHKAAFERECKIQAIAWDLDVTYEEVLALIA